MNTERYRVYLTKLPEIGKHQLFLLRNAADLSVSEACHLRSWILNEAPSEVMLIAGVPQNRAKFLLMQIERLGGEGRVAPCDLLHPVRAAHWAANCYVEKPWSWSGIRQVDPDIYQS